MAEVVFPDGEETRFDIRLVPIAAAQIQALASLERAFSGLAEDFWRDYGADRDDRIAGGLFRLSSTLEMLIDQWRNASEHVAVAEGRRRALERIAGEMLTLEEAREVAASALQPKANDRTAPTRPPC